MSANGMSGKVRLLANLIIERKWYAAGSVMEEELIPVHLRLPEYLSHDLEEVDSLAAAYNAVDKSGEPVVHSARRVIPPGGTGPVRAPRKWGAGPTRMHRGAPG
jgi:hypothetical protein